MTWRDTIRRNVAGQEQISDNRLEQKLAFAERYFVNRNDAIMIAAKVLGDEAVENPMLAINFGNTWPFDPVVVAELERRSQLGRPKGEYIATAWKWAQQCMDRGEEGAAKDLLKLAAEIENHLPRASAANAKTTNPNGNGHELDLLEAIVDPDNRREDDNGAAAQWQ